MIINRKLVEHTVILFPCSSYERKTAMSTWQVYKLIGWIHINNKWLMKFKLSIICMSLLTSSLTSGLRLLLSLLSWLFSTKAIFGVVKCYILLVHFGGSFAPGMSSLERRKTSFSVSSSFRDKLVGLAACDFPADSLSTNNPRTHQA